ncbi:MaoC/PaaZ C-terminal domain-containing protein [Bordetella petrii]|uniref:MaoC/PaaZ C-terminal domain-containing protein n=1 Tax=Bordetella petrii TaxID=94624 RepID=UPI001E65A922|nr:MaoC/PaaZ C-terminal domain-containing protein [Bordetella petrii]MCD0504734.1 MaoC family dehydratase N-terminal domain-containing protein [Bordetella petrii]
MHSLYFHDFHPGQTFESGGRTITEADLTMFSMLSGDWNPIHADAAYAAGTRYGQRLVHGTLGIALATGMMHELGIFHRSVVAMLSLREWKFLKPIFIGDTLHLQLEILAVNPGTSERVGAIDRRLRMVNQDGVTVQDGSSEVLVLKNRP